MLAGILANRLNIEWRGAKGEPMTPNYNGCITQLDQKGGGVGYRNVVKGLADASMAAVGGWVRKLKALFFYQISFAKLLTSVVSIILNRIFDPLNLVMLSWRLKFLTTT